MSHRKNPTSVKQLFVQHDTIVQPLFLFFPAQRRDRIPFPSAQRQRVSAIIRIGNPEKTKTIRAHQRYIDVLRNRNIKWPASKPAGRWL